MKRSLAFLVIAMFAITTIQAQMRHVGGIKSIGLGYGYQENGYQISASYGHRLSTKIEVKGNLFYEGIDFKLSDASLFGINPQAVYTVKKVGEFYYIGIKAGLILGVENTNNKILDEKKSGFCFGESIGLSNEFYITNTITTNIDFEQRFFQKSLFGGNSFLVSISLNYKL